MRRFASDDVIPEVKPESLTVGTSDCSLGTIAFYRKVGFRFAGVREGYFDTYPMAVVGNGIRARDMVMFRMALPPEPTRT
jgi:RimJ/RimL family protein N-acetyltransferase